MTAPRRDGPAPSVPAERVAAYRAMSRRPPVTVQLNGLAADIATLDALALAGSSHVPGAALAVAYAALRLAVTPAIDDATRDLRRRALRAAMASLDRAKLGHVAELIAAALAYDVDPATVARGVERPQ